LATIDYSGALSIDLEADDLFSHVAVYVPVGESFFAVEPVTNANDAFTLHDAGIPGSGIFVVEPGQTVEAEFAFVVR
jgi:aldose 1-epimerase